MAELDYQPCRWVCKGRIYHESESVLMVVLSRVENDRLASASADGHYSLTKGTRWLRPGAEYEIQTATTEDGGTSLLASKAKYLNMWPNAEEIATWQAITHAAEAMEAADRKHTREADGSKQLLKQLRSLRREYTRTIGRAKKLALEMSVLNALRTPYKETEGD